MSQIDSKYRK